MILVHLAPRSLFLIVFSKNQDSSEKWLTLSEVYKMSVDIFIQTNKHSLKYVKGGSKIILCVKICSLGPRFKKINWNQDYNQVNVVLSENIYLESIYL